MIKKCENLLAAIIDEGDYGEYTFYNGQYNELLAGEYAALGKTEDTLHYFEKAVEGWIAYSKLPEEVDSNLDFDFVRDH